MPISKATAIRLSIAALVLGSGIFDTITFLANPQYHAFEANPLYLATKSIALVVILKAILVVILAYSAIKPISRSKTMRYAYVLVFMFATIIQVLGGISNIQIAHDKPTLDRVLPPAQAIAEYNKFAMNYYILPIAASLLAFKIYEWANYGSD